MAIATNVELQKAKNLAPIYGVFSLPGWFRPRWPKIPGFTPYRVEDSAWRHQKSLDRQYRKQLAIALEIPVPAKTPNQLIGNLQKNVNASAKRRADGARFRRLAEGEPADFFPRKTHPSAGLHRPNRTILKPMHHPLLISASAIAPGRAPAPAAALAA